MANNWPKRRWGLALAVISLAALMPQSAGATDRFYRDQTVKSSSGRYRLEAKSPDNAGDHPKAFARNFTYTLFDTETDRVLWARQQPKSEGSPVTVFLHDELWVAIRTAGNTLVVLQPVTGRKTLGFNILDEFPQEEQSRYVSRTTAGKMWAGSSRWSFLPHEGKMYFVIRAWWDRRVIANLSDASVVRNPDAALQTACDAGDRSFVLTTLEGARDRVKAGVEAVNYRVFRRVVTAVNLAGRARVHEAIPLLRELEHSNYVGSRGGWGDHDGIYHEGDINPFSEAHATLRRAAHLALRHLGEKPKELPCTWFRYEKTRGLGDYVTVPELPAERAERVELVEPGMKPIDVLHVIGAPDYVNFGSQAWEYDMDVVKPYTLRVFWRDKEVVDRCERVEPAVWQQGDLRYYQINR